MMYYRTVNNFITMNIVQLSDAKICTWCAGLLCSAIPFTVTLPWTVCKCSPSYFLSVLHSYFLSVIILFCSSRFLPTRGKTKRSHELTRGYHYVQVSLGPPISLPHSVQAISHLHCYYGNSKPSTIC